MADETTIISDTSSLVSKASTLVTRCESLHETINIAKKRAAKVIGDVPVRDEDDDDDDDDDGAVYVETAKDRQGDLMDTLELLPKEVTDLMGAIASLEKDIMNLFKAERRIPLLVDEESKRLNRLDAQAAPIYQELLRERKRHRVNVGANAGGDANL